MSLGSMVASGHRHVEIFGPQKTAKQRARILMGEYVELTELSLALCVLLCVARPHTERAPF